MQFLEPLVFKPSQFAQPLDTEVSDIFRLADIASLRKDAHPVRDFEDFFFLRGNYHYRYILLMRHVLEYAVNLTLSADIHTFGGFIKHQ